MKILMINASPRANGNISKMLAAVEDEARQLGATVEVVRVAELNVKPCTGCMVCRSKFDCVLPEDSAQQVLKQIREADALVIGAPCYWGGMPGNLKTLFDRMVYGMMDENRLGIPIPLHKGKRAAIISTCTTLWPFNIWFNQTRGVVKGLHEILKWSGFKLVATLEKGGTKNGSGFTAKEERKCRKIAKKLIA